MSGALDTRQLLAFAALARRHSFTLAAKDLHLTQSAVSHAIRALEEELGCRLFDRSGRGVKTTAAGEQLLRHVDKILAEMAAARTGLDALTRWGHSRLRVGASTTACQYILPTVLREFRQSFPECIISVETGDTPRQLELLRSNVVDLALAVEPERERDLETVPLFEDELRLIVAPVHPWVRQGVPPDGFARETLVLYNRSSFTFAMIHQYLREEGAAPRQVIELGSVEAIKELVKIGLGLGVLAPWVVRPELESGVLVSLPLGRRALRRRWSIASLAGRKRPPGEETFIGLCQAVAGELAAPPRPERPLARAAGA